MAEKKSKISIRKVIQVLLTFVLTICAVVAMVSASNIEGSKKVQHIEVHIQSGKKYHFIEEQQILNKAIYNRGIDINNISLSALDVQSMEHVIMSDPWVEKAQLHVDNQKVLHINVIQRIPVARIFEQNGLSYYMDSTLSIMPLAHNFIFYTSVVTNMPHLGNDSVSLNIKKQLLYLVRKIQTDTFWSAQISQIIVDSANQFELMPVLGNHKIKFGDTSNATNKLANLFSFYKNVLNRIGWDKYDVLDVRFEGQVVASPSLPYKGPVDKASKDINWINSIVKTEALNDSLMSAKSGGVREDAKETPKPVAKAADKKEETPKKADKNEKKQQESTKKDTPKKEEHKDKRVEDKKKEVPKKEDKKKEDKKPHEVKKEEKSKNDKKVEEKKHDKKVEAKKPEPKDEKKKAKEKPKEVSKEKKDKSPKNVLTEDKIH